MFILPDPSHDYEVEVAAFANGGDATTVRIIYGLSVPFNADVAQLFSKRRLPCSDFPLPARYHIPPNHSSVTQVPQKVHLLAYNGLPNVPRIYSQYPNTTQQKLNSAFNELFPDHLCYVDGVTSSRWDQDTIFHRVSSHVGASGAGLFNNDGKLIGISVCHQTC
jgi:hypothetical protein